jgi:hypothetical protein
MASKRSRCGGGGCVGEEANRGPASVPSWPGEGAGNGSVIKLIFYTTPAEVVHYQWVTISKMA